MLEAAIVSPVLSLLPLSFLGFEALGGTLAIVLGLGVLIFVHELGHFLAAKWAGVKVEVFSLGMGPRLFGVVRGDTDYRISALPLGGYVKMLGQDDSDPTQERTSAPEDFRNKPPYKRFIILVAGVAMNTVFAMVAFIIAFAVGVEFVAPEVGAVVPGSAASQARVVSSPSKPAAQGLQESDQIVSINDTEILAWEDIQTAVALAGEKIRVEVDRPTPSGATERVVLEASPQRHEDEAYPQLGIQPVLMIAELDEGSPLKGKIEKGDQLIDIAPVGSAGAEPHKGPNLTLRAVQESAGKPVRLHLQRRRYDEDGRPLPESPRTFDVEVVPEARPVYEIGVDLELGERPRVSGVVPGAPAKGVIETNDSIVSLDGRPALASTLPEIVRAAGDSHAKAGEELSSPVPIVVERRKGNRLEQLETQVRLKRKQTGDGWQLG
ncbi:site-2 protease family protein, partial [bacterium]|nr:site-2 protease family protein [bacterium]